MKFSNFTEEKKSLYIAWACFRNVSRDNQRDREQPTQSETNVNCRMQIPMWEQQVVHRQGPVVQN